MSTRMGNLRPIFPKLSQTATSLPEFIAQGLNALARHWKSSDPYPQGATFGELLDWHLVVGGTNPKSTPAERSDPWVKRNFAELVHSGLPATEEENNPERKLWNWRFGVNLPREGRITQNIFDALFGDNPALAHWKRDLREALEREREAKVISAPKRGVTDPAGAPRIAHFMGRDDQVVALAAELGIRRELIEVLALRFGHTSPDDPDATLIDFLKSKAREYHELKARMDALLDSEAQFSNLTGAAQAALEEGKFDEAEDTLRIAEESYQEERTLKAIRAQARIRIFRGDASLLAGDRDEGWAHYETAAQYFHSFDLDEEAKCRASIAFRKLDEYGLRPSICDRCIKFIQPMEEAFPAGSVNWAATKFYIGYFYCPEDYYDQYDSEDLYDRACRAQKALSYFENALSLFRKEDDAEVWGKIQKHYAIAMYLMTACFAESGQNDLTQARVEKIVSHNNLAQSALDPVENPIRWLEISYVTLKSLFLSATAAAKEDRIPIYQRCLDVLRTTFSHRDLAENSLIWHDLSGAYLKTVNLLFDLMEREEWMALYQEVEARVQLEKDIVLKTRSLSEWEGVYHLLWGGRDILKRKLEGDDPYPAGKAFWTWWTNLGRDSSS